MNLKSILGKVIASIVALYLVLGNFAIAGLGIAEVIAEEVYTPELAVEQNIDKYVQYNKENYKGAEIQTSISVIEKTSKENHLPVNSMKLQIQVPNIDGILPNRVNIIKTNTLLTNGTENYSVNQNYNKDTGLLIVSYENLNNYSEYKENAKDEFEIIYIYPEGAYANNNEKKEIKQEVNIEAGYKVYNQLLNSHARKNISVTMSAENLNSLEAVNYEIIGATEVYKGYMYANEQYGNTYKTDYKLTEKLSVLNKDLIDELTVILEQSSYKDSNSKEIKASSTIYKTSKISSTDFYRLLGIDGYMDFYLGNTKYATIKYSDSDDKGNRNYETVYYTVEKENVEAGKVEYPSNTKNVIIKTSKPTGEGIALLENEKQIISQSKYEKEVKDLKEIKESRNCIVNKIETVNGEQKVTQIENKNNTGIISLKEPTTKISLDLSSNKLSTLTTNNITATIKIDDTNSSCKLVSAGKIEITLPNNLTNVKIRNARSLYENGVYIKTARVENGKIILEVEGKQTTYDNANISGGLNIILDLELDIEDTSSSHKENITAKYNDAEVSREIDIVSKYGLLMETVIKNETKNSEEIKAINQNKTIEISANDVKQVEQIELNIVNNYENDVSDIQFIGNLQYVDEINKPTFNLTLEQGISVSKGKVLYSNDGNTWSEQYNSQAIFFKIELPQNKLARNDSIKAVLKLAIPANLEYNEEAYIGSKLTYKNGVTDSNLSSIIGFKTQTSRISTSTKKININNLEITSSIKSGGEYLNDSSILKENQIIKYEITIKNTGDNKIDDLQVKANIPYNTTLVKMKVDNYLEMDQEWYTEYQDRNVLSEIVSLNKNDKYTFSYNVKINNISEGRSEINQFFDININNNKITTITNNNMLQKGLMQVLLMDGEDSSNQILTGYTRSYFIKIKNFSDKELKNVSIRANIIGNINSDYKIYTPNLEETVETINIKPSETVILRLLIDNKSLQTEKSDKENVGIHITTTYQNENYYSNEIIQEVKQNNTKMEVQLLSNINETNVYDETEMIYTIKVKNIGYRDAEANLYYALPEGLKLKRKVIASKGIDQTYDDLTESEIEFSTEIKSQETIEVILYVKVDGYQKKINNEFSIDSEGNTVKKTTYSNIENIKNIVYVSGSNFNDVQSNEISYNILYKNTPDTPDNPATPENPDTPDNPTTPENPDVPEEQKHSISGLAWLDTNKDGQRDEGEKSLSGIKVYLVNSKTGKIVTDSEGKNITVITGENGEYKFEGITEGSYIVIYEFDINRYKATRYQTPGVDSTLNSDAIINKVTVEGQEKITGATNVLKLTTDLNNIDIGLIENAKFDLSLDKQISKVQVVNSQGTKTKEYENLNFAKVDLVAKYMNNTSVIVTYKFVITNNGDVTGYVENLKDSLPTGLEFSSELNKDWYKAEDGNLYTSSLNGIAIEPGKSTEIELILTKETTENSTGTFKNNAELANISNIEAIEESSTDNNKSSADLLISIKTGSPILYIGITLGSIVLIAIASYIIKKKILDRGI